MQKCILYFYKNIVCFIVYFISLQSKIEHIINKVYFSITSKINTMGIKTKKRIVDVLSTSLKFSKENERVDFETILKFIDKKSITMPFKEYEFSLLDNELANCLIGVVETNQDKEIPPKKNKKDKSIKKIDLDPDTESLVFANVFIYDVKRNIFIYEVNRDGCYIKDFIEAITLLWNAENDERFDLHFPAVIRLNGYERLLDLTYYSKVIVELYKPQDLVNVLSEKKSSLAAKLIDFHAQKAVETNADIITIEEEIFTKKVNPLGLNRSFIQQMSDVIKNLVKAGYKQNINVAKVLGYAEDPESPRSLKPISLMADTFEENFKISAVKIHSDIQKLERKEGIIKVYNKILPEIKIITGI